MVDAGTLVYLYGPPGSGKSTLMAELTKSCDRSATSVAKVPHDVLLRDGRIRGAEIGRRREAFSGTDALSMSIQPEAVSWVRTAPYRLILGEGARLATKGFLEAAETAGYRVCPVFLDAPEDVMAERRMRRGSNQDEKWVRGATTRASNLQKAMISHPTVGAYSVDATRAPAEIAQTLFEAFPILEVLR